MDDFFDYINNVVGDNTLKKMILPTAALILYLVGLLYITILFNKIKIPSNNTNTVTKESTNDNSYIFIDIKGSVKNPGVYKLESDARVIDALLESGGILENANTRFLNLSKSLNDGDVIVVYSNEEIEEAKKQETINIETPCICEEVKSDACYSEEGKEDNGKININVATLDELKILPGIGDAKASAIIDYRNTNGNFKSIEEIKNISGISDKLYEQIKDFITV